MHFFDDESKSRFEIVKQAFAPFGAELFFAGGCVRDMLLGQAPKDFDIEIYGVHVADFKFVLESIGAVGVGKAFFVYKFYCFDISLPRSENKVSAGHRGFDVEVVKDKKLACSRRDFTINSMLFNISSGKVIDFFGGRLDIEDKLIKATDQDSFADDSLRVLRAMQFASRFGFKIEQSTIELCKSIDLSDISPERVFIEFEKMFTSKHLIYGVYYFFALGISDKLFGINGSFKDFLAIARALKKYALRFHKKSEYLFLYHICMHFRFSKNRFLGTISAPNRYSKALTVQKYIPKKVTDRFLIGLALKIEIKDWLGAYGEGIFERANRLGIWDKKYTPDITSRKLMDMGFKGASISKNYSLMLAQEIRVKFER